MAKALTAPGIEKLKPDPAKRLEIPDGLLTGLYFVVQPSGKKSWAVRYRSHGKPRKMVLGGYPALELAAAREEAQAVLRRVQQGEDPGAERQIEKKQMRDGEIDDLTRFENVVRSFLARYAKPKNRSWKGTARQLGLAPDQKKIAAATDADAASALVDDPKAFAVLKGSPVDKWGHRPIAGITRAEVIAFIDGIVDRGAPVSANRTFAALRKLFNWAVERSLLETTPCERVKPPTAEKSRDRVLTDEEIRLLWTACEAIGWPFGPLIQLLLVTGQRREEVASMRWREVKDDTWTIPRERVKNDRVHEVHLSSSALSILDGLHRVDGAGLVFTTNGRTAVSGFSKAKSALDEKMLEALRKRAVENDLDPEGVSLEPWRLHDIRRTVASGMAKIGISLAAIEKILNHTSGSFGGIVGVYQRHEFAEEKRRALNAWADYLATLVSDKPADNVIAFQGGAS